MNVSHISLCPYGHCLYFLYDVPLIHSFAFFFRPLKGRKGYRPIVPVYISLLVKTVGFTGNRFLNGI